MTVPNPPSGTTPAGFDTWATTVADEVNANTTELAGLPGTYVGSLAGTLSARPAASADNARWTYFATDVAGGTLYRSNGSSWVAVAMPVNGSNLLARKGAVYFDGTSGNRASLPDPASLPPASGDLDIRGFGLTRVEAAGQNTLVAHQGIAGNRSWQMRVHTADQPQLNLSTDGTAETIVAFPVLPYALTDRFDLRITRRQSDGRHQCFIKAPTVDTWEQHGTDQTALAGVALFDSTAIVSVGSIAGGGANWKGRVGRIEIRNGIDGTVIAAPDFTRAWSPRFRDSAGGVWTMDGTTWAWSDQ
jgi:hypothetical protein